MVSKTFKATDRELQSASDFLEAQAELLEFSPKASMQILMALEELFVNVCHYAYDESSPGDITINVETEDNKLSVTLIDDGPMYNPLLKEDPDTTLDASDRPIGGLGIFLVKKTMDETSYRYENNQNIFTFVKNKD